MKFLGVGKGFKRVRIKYEFKIRSAVGEKGIDHMPMILDDPLYGGNGAGFQRSGKIGVSDSQDENERCEGNQDHADQDDAS